ncbi:MAG: glycosyltransferase family 2 protein [Archaeoglobus sp.]|nr:glycosyltransferase family 2 protein [Archaeoglobus sp.]
MGIVALIPAYNEELTIGSVVLKTKPYVDKVIVVDDGSEDRTSEIAEKAGAEVIRIEKNIGKANAIKLGFEKVREEGWGVVVLLDADGQHDPDEIPELVKPVLENEADVVIGSRFLNGNAEIPRYRLFGQRILNFLTNVGTRTKISDTQSGYRVLSYKALERLDLTVTAGYNLESDMILSLGSNGIRITELPITVRYDVPSKHKCNPILHGFSILTNLVGQLSFRNPIFLFSLPGVVFLLIAASFWMWALSTYTSSGSLSFGPTMAAGILTIIGSLSFVTGLILNTLVQILKRVREF